MSVRSSLPVPKILSTVAQGDLLYAVSAGTMDRLAKDTTATRYLANTGASNAPAWNQVNLLNGVTDILYEAHGGTGWDTYAQGDLLYASAANTLSRLAKTALSTRYLTNQGTDNDPAWGLVNLSNGITDILDGNNIYGIWNKYTSTVTGSQNNLDITSGATVQNSYIEWSGASDATITGIDLGSANPSSAFLLFKNTGTKVAYFSYQSGSSDADNRFTNYLTSSTTPVAPKGWIAYVHNGTNWIMVGHEQGANITPSFSAGDWTGSGSMTVTVASGDVLTDAYRVVGKTFNYWFFLNTITIAGTPSTAIYRAIPNSFAFTTGGTGSGGPMRVYDNGTYRSGFAFVYTPSSSTQILFTIQDLSAYAASTNNSGLFGFISFEID